MAFSKLEFSKNWTSAEDFPTYESQENQVREDLQLLHDETKNAFNQLVEEELIARNIPFDDSKCSFDADNIQKAIEEVNSNVQAASRGDLTPGAINTDYLSHVRGEEAVDTGAIQDKAVTGEKIADGTITEEKFAEGAFDNIKIGSKVISGNNVMDDSIGDEQLTPSSITGRVIAPHTIQYYHLATGNPEVDGTNGTGVYSAAVVTNTIADLAVTNDKLAGNIESDKLKSVDAGKITTGVIDVARIPDMSAAKMTSGTLPNERLSSVPFSCLNALVVTTESTQISTDGVWVTCAGVTPSSHIVVSPGGTDESFANWRNYGVRCIEQGTNQIKLKSDVATWVIANVLIFN